MNERSFRALFHDSIGEAVTPPDLLVTSRRALARPLQSRPWRTIEALAAVATILFAAAIIGYSLVSQQRPTQPGVSPGPSAAATPTVAPTPTPSPPGPQACTADQLTLTPGGTQGAAGHMFASATLTNSSSVPCTILGFPSAQLLAPDQSPLPTRVVDQGGQLSNTPAPAMFLLSPGQKAGFQVSWGDVPVGNETCAAAGSIEIGPPGQAPSSHLALTNLRATVCNSGELDTSAIAASG